MSAKKHNKLRFSLNTSTLSGLYQNKTLPDLPAINITYTQQLVKSENYLKNKLQTYYYYINSVNTDIHT